MPELAVSVAVVLFAVMGIAALVAPNRVTKQFGIPPLTTAGRNEVRAVYGGFGLAMAAMLIVAMTTPHMRSSICLTIAAAMAGMAVGRVVSAVIDRALPARPLFYLVVEVVVAALLVFGAS